MAAILLGGRWVTALFVDRGWFAALNAEPVFWEQTFDTFALRGGLWILGTLFAFANLYAIRKTISAVAVPSRIANIELTSELPPRRLLAFTAVSAALVGFLLTVPFDDWTPLALARHGIAFNEIEFYFLRDLGFYVYWLPLEETLYVWSLLAIVVLIAIVIVLYVLTRSLRLDGRRIVSSNHARKHLTVLGALIMMLLAWSYRLDGYDLLRYGSGSDGMFLRVDHVVTLKIDFALALISVFASFVLLSAGWKGQVRLATATLTVVLLGALGVRHGLPLILASGEWLGNPARRELDYVAARALVTRRAYDVDGIGVVNADTAHLSGPVFRLRDLPRVLSVWDAVPLSRALAPGGDGRVPVGPVSWSLFNGAMRGLVLQKPFPGDGLWTLVSINGTTADERGAPVHNGADVDGPIDSAAMNIADDVSVGSITEPLIAPGAAGHRVVYDGSTRVVGARLDGVGSRIAHAWATRDPRLLSQGENGATATLVLWRDVRDRVHRLAPVFVQGQDVVPILHEGILYWAVELYSASDTYPLSQRWTFAGDVRSYFRHAATALVDSRTGRVRLVMVHNPDPVARTWMAVAPTLFVAVDKVAPGLAQQLPAPTDGIDAQIRAFARFGSRTEGPALRHLPDSILANDTQPGILIEGKTPSVGWSVPLLNSPEQIAGIAYAVGGATRGARWSPVAQPEVRWSVLLERLRNALDSSRAALAEGGKREPIVSYGRVRIVLVDGNPVAMQPLYVTRLNGSQAVARVAIASQAAVVVGASTADAVRQLDGSHAGSSGNTTGGPGDPLSAAGRDVVIARLYETMRSAMRRGDWVHFGQAFDSLGILLGHNPP
ncbi:MAG: UPF0182 family protein [Gemmatimonadota bacterium]|nr:UPF0182 family protein [Gemmatimonadota bacterium]